MQQRTEFQRLVPLIVSRDCVGVRRLLEQRASGALSFEATLAALEQLPMSRTLELINAHAAAQAEYDRAFEQWRNTRGDRWTVANVLGAKNAAWRALERVRSEIQAHLRR